MLGNLTNESKIDELTNSVYSFVSFSLYLLHRVNIP